MVMPQYVMNGRCYTRPTVIFLASAELYYSMTEAQGREHIAQSRYAAVARPRVVPVTSWSQVPRYVRRSNMPPTLLQRSSLILPT